MKIAITSVKNDLDSPVSHSYELTNYILIVDSDTLTLTSFLNPDYKHPGVSGIHKGEIIRNYGIKNLVTGKCGTKASKILNSLGVNVYEAMGGSIKENINAFVNNKLIKKSAMETYGLLFPVHC